MHDVVDTFDYENVDFLYVKKLYFIYDKSTSTYYTYHTKLQWIINVMKHRESLFNEVWYIIWFYLKM